MKSRKNKILLAWLKDRKFLHQWLQWEREYRGQAFLSAAEEHCYLDAKNMNEARTAVQTIMFAVAPSLNWRITGRNNRVCRLADWIMYHSTLYIDNEEGLCADGEPILQDYAVRAVDEEYYHEDDVYYSNVLGEYVPVGEEAVYSEYHRDYLYRPDAFFSEILNDWFVSEDELLKAERKHELEEVTA